MLIPLPMGGVMAHSLLQVSELSLPCLAYAPLEANSCGGWGLLVNVLFSFSLPLSLTQPYVSYPSLCHLRLLGSCFVSSGGGGGWGVGLGAVLGLYVGLLAPVGPWFSPLAFLSFGSLCARVVCKLSLVPPIPL